MSKPNLATAGHSATPNPKSPTGGHQRPPSDSRGTDKAGNGNTAANSAHGIIVFGLDPTGKSKAATFPAHQVDLATKAAGLMQLRVPEYRQP